MSKAVEFCFIKNKLSFLIWKTSLPMIGAILALLSYDLLESSLLALSGATTLTALGFTLPLTTAITAVSIGLSISSNNKVVKVACLDKKNIADTITTALFCTVLIVGILSFGAYLANELLLSLLGNNLWAETNHTAEKSIIIIKQQNHMAARYVSWVFLAIIWQVNAIFRALGNSIIASSIMFGWLAIKSSLALLLLAPSSNEFTDVLTGLTYVHIISDVAIALISLLILIKKLQLTLPDNFSIIKRLLAAKIDTAIIVAQQLITPISMALLTIIAASIDYNYVAAFALILRMEALFLLAPMVLTTSIPAIIGSNFWSGNKVRVLQTYVFSFSLIVIIQLLIAINLFFFSENFSLLFCSQNVISNYITRYFTWVSWGYLSIGCIMVYQSSLNAKGKTIQAILLGLSHRILILLPFAYIGSAYTLEDSFYQGLLFGHVVDAPMTVNDHFYQGILTGHIISGLLMLAFLYKNTASKNLSSNKTKTPLNLKKFTNKYLTFNPTIEKEHEN